MQRVFATALLLVPLCTGAQTLNTPYSAHFREYGTRKHDGKMESFSRQGLKACNSQGQIFEGEYQPSGTAYKSETIFDPAKQLQYIVDPVGKSAITKPAEIKPFHPPADPPIGSEVVGSVATSVYPITNSQTKSADGKLWVAHGTNVVVKIFINLPTGETYGYELSDISIGREPDSSLFKLPVGVKIAQ